MLDDRPMKLGNFKRLFLKCFIFRLRFKKHFIKNTNILANRLWSVMCYRVSSRARRIQSTKLFFNNIQEFRFVNYDFLLCIARDLIGLNVGFFNFL